MHSMLHNKAFRLFLIFIIISFSNCLKTTFNITKIEKDADSCNQKEGTYYFTIYGVFNGDTTYIFYLNLLTPSNAEALCIPFDSGESHFTCYLQVAYYPLIEKKVAVQKGDPSYYRYSFPNWEEFFESHSNIIDENAECTPIINTTFVYSSLELNNNKLIIKGEWLDLSTITIYTIQVKVRLTNSSMTQTYCTLNLEKKTEFECEYSGVNIPIIEDQLIATNNYVYKLEKKRDENTDDLNSEKICYSNLYMVLLLVYLLLL